MARSKLSIFVSILSLLVAVASILTLFSGQRTASTGTPRLSATTSAGGDPAALLAPLPIDPAMVGYHQTATFAVEFKKVLALAVDTDDRIYVAGDQGLCRFTPQGRLDMRIALSDEPTCLAVANRQHFVPGRIYVGFVDHVELYGAEGAKTANWQGLGERARLTSISTSEHYVFIADAGQDLVQRFDATGKLLESFGGSSTGHFTAMVHGANLPFDLAVGLDDLVYATNRRDNRVEGYSFEGEMERHWGQGSPAIEDFAGAHNPSHLVITPDGRFVTAEDDPLRVKVYLRSGEFESVVCGPDECGPVVGIASDSHKRILVLDGQAHCVRVLEANKPAAPSRR